MEENEHTAPEPGQEEGRVLCTVCVHSNDSRANYCAKCGAPINTLLTFAPFDQTLLEGFAYRRAVDGPPSKVILAGMWLLFGPVLVVAPLVLASGYHGSLGLGPASERVFWLVYCLMAAVILYRVTRNFLSKRRRAEAAKLTASNDA